MKKLTINVGVCCACFFSYAWEMHAQGCIALPSSPAAQPLQHRTMEDRDALLARLFPYTYRYDSGRFQVHASFSEAKAWEIYYESEEIKAQFFRLMGSREALRYGLPANDDTVHFRVYASREDLDTYQEELFEYPAPNGGLYLPLIGTAIAHEGEEQEAFRAGRMRSTLRHEYVHYLQHKYLYHGRRGFGEIWHIEGMAVFFEGATRADEVRLLSAGSVFTHRAYRKMRLGDVIFSDYANGIVPYLEGALLVAYLYYHERDILHELIELARDAELVNDPSPYENFLFHLVENQPLEKAYQEYASRAFQQEDNRVVPGLSWIEDKFLREKQPAILLEAFEQEGLQPLSHTLLSTNPAGLNTRMRLHTVMRADPIASASVGEGLRAFNPVLNDKLRALAHHYPELSNLQAATAYCTRITLTVQEDGTHIPKGDCYFEVPLRPEGVDYVEPTLMVTPEVKALNKEGGRFEISVHANSSSWSVSENHAWIGLSDGHMSFQKILIGNENGKVELHYGSSGRPRRAEVVVKSTGGLTRVIYLTQQSVAVHIYPNPAREQVSLTVQEEGLVRIMDAQGAFISSHAVQADVAYTIDLSSYHAGMYVLELQDSNGRHVQRFIRR